MSADQWLRAMEANRQRKDEFFRTAPESPIPVPDRPRFGGLAYFALDPAYRVAATLEPGHGERIRMQRTGGDEVEYERAGRLRFAVPTGQGELTAYRTPGHDNELFVPFRDATSGPKTYGAGRYVEARPIPDGRWVLDLNQAYHPYCAYDDAYSCPMVPPENWLRFPVEAGERL